jgi:hypothetical protein
LEELSFTVSASENDLRSRISHLGKEKEKLGKGRFVLRADAKLGLRWAPMYIFLWGGMTWAAMALAKLMGCPPSSTIGAVLAVNLVTEIHHIRMRTDTFGKAFIDLICKSVVPLLVFTMKIV